MNTSGEAADQVVRMSMQAGEAALKITGTGAKHLAVLLYAIFKEQKKTAGRAKMETLVQSGKPLTVFSVQQKDLKKFMDEAKRYGILFSAVRDTKNKSDTAMVDIIVKSEDAPRMNRIVENLGLATVRETAKVSTEMDFSKDAKPKAVKQDKEAQLVDDLFENRVGKDNRITAKEDEEAQLVDDLLEKPIRKDAGMTAKQDKPEQSLKEPSQNSEKQNTPQTKEVFFRNGLKSRQSENTSNKPRSAERTISNSYTGFQKPSVRGQIRELEASRKTGQTQKQTVRDSVQKDAVPKMQKPLQHQQPNSRRRKKSKER